MPHLEPEQERPASDGPNAPRRDEAIGHAAGGEPGGGSTAVEIRVAMSAARQAAPVAFAVIALATTFGVPAHGFTAADVYTP